MFCARLLRHKFHSICCKRLISLDSKELILSPSIDYQRGNEILFKKANKSILVITETLPEEAKLQNFLQKFGKIECLHKLNPGENHNYLVEFSSFESLKLISNELSSDVMIDRVLPLSQTSQSNKIKQSKGPPTYENEKEIYINEMRKLSSIEEQMRYLMKQRETTTSEIASRYFVMSLINEVLLKSQLTRKYKNKLFPFGSGMSGIGQRNSDVDINVFIKNARDISEILEEIGHELCTHMPMCDNFEFIPEARVPVYTFNFKPIELSVDVTAQPDWDAHKILQCLNWYCRHSEYFRLLVFNLRFWAKGFLHHGMGGHWTPFLFNCLIMFYLMRIALPPFRDVLSNKRKCTFKDEDFKLSLDKILLGFFVYYKNFDFRRQKINLLFGSIKNNPSGRFYIEHPFVNGHNMSMNLSIETVLEFQEQCANVAETLKLNAGLVDPQRDWGMCLVLQDNLKQRMKF